MKTGRSLLLIAIAASAISPLAVIGVDAPTTTPAVAPTTAPAADVFPIDAIRKAPNPSAAVEAYARASAKPHDDIALQEAYVRRMVDFGMPDLAETQAQNLMEHAPDLALPWAVTAYMAAARGEPAMALANLETALRKDPDDAFILRTAAQAMAWYDAEPDKSKFTDATKSNVDFIRNQTKSYALFNEEYRDAMDARRNDQAPTTQPGPPVQIIPSTTNYPPPAEPTGPQIVETYGPRVYSDPYDYVYTRDRYLYSPSVIIVPSRNFHDRHHDDHHDGDHGRDHGRRDWGTRQPLTPSPTPTPPRVSKPAQPEVGKPFFQARDKTRVVPSTPGVMGPERAPAASKSNSAAKSSGKSGSSGSSKSNSSSSSDKSSGSRTSSKGK